MNFRHIFNSSWIQIPLNKKFIVLKLIINNFKIFLLIVDHFDDQNDFITCFLEYVC